MKITVKGALRIGATIIGGVIILVVVLTAINRPASRPPVSGLSSQESASLSSASTPTSSFESAAPVPVPTPAITPVPASHETVVARRGIDPLSRLIEQSCDAPDTIDIDGWRIEGDTVIYSVSDSDTEWTSTASTSFAALDAGATSPVFVTDVRDWASNGCAIK
jgi:hypothetical protein